MKGNHIGELEELVLLAVGSLYKEGAYAVAIVDVIKENSNRILDVTAIHAVLRRLERGQSNYDRLPAGGRQPEHPQR